MSSTTRAWMTRLRFKDFADKLDDDYNRIFNGERIDVACHSTGALVVRSWLALRRETQRQLNLSSDCPVEHLLMFAPANFGSDLAKLGQSFFWARSDLPFSIPIAGPRISWSPEKRCYRDLSPPARFNGVYI